MGGWIKKRNIPFPRAVQILFPYLKISLYSQIIVPVKEISKRLSLQSQGKRSHSSVVA